MDISGYLQSKGLNLKHADSRNVHTSCVFCDEDPTKRGRLYINIDPDAEIPGLFLCHRCQEKGSLSKLKKHFGDEGTQDELDGQVRADLLREAALYYHRNLKHFGEVLQWLTGPERGLTLETIRKYQIGYAPMEFTLRLDTGNMDVRRPRELYRHLQGAGFEVADIVASGLCQSNDSKVWDSLGGMVTIPYFVAGNVVAVRGRGWPVTPTDFEAWEGAVYKPPAGKYKTCGGTRSRLFNSDACWETDEVTVCEGEFDALVVEQHGFRAVAAPGAASWQDTWDDYFTNIRRVWLLFDRDAAGSKAAAKLQDRLGDKAREVHLSEVGVKCDPTQWFARDGHTAAEFAELLASGRKGPLLVTVREAIEEFTSMQSQPGLKFAWEMFDLAQEPGLQPGQLLLVLAKTGTGKSIFLINLMHRVRMVPGQEDLKVLFVSLEQTRGEWWDRARRIFRFFHADATDEDAARWWDDHIMLVDRNRLTVDGLTSVIEDFTYHMGRIPDLMTVDYLGYWARAFKGEAYQRTSDAVMALKGIAKEHRIPVIAPHQVSRTGIDGQEFGAEAARDSGVIEETADHLLTMWSPDNSLGRTEGEKNGAVHLRIGKSRHGGRGQLLTMQFAPISLVMIPDGDPLCGKARREITWKRDYRDSWDKAAYRHRTGFEGALADSFDLD